MTIEDLIASWEKDSKLDLSDDLTTQSLGIAKLHSKYYSILIKEQLILDEFQMQLGVLRKDKFIMFTQGPSKEHHDKGWGMPAIGKVTKSDAEIYFEGDPDYITIMRRISIQKHKVDMLESIIRIIPNRSFHIGNAIDKEKFRHGA